MRKKCNTLILLNLFGVLALSIYLGAQETQRDSNSYQCTEPQPEQVCNESNTCGVSQGSCVVNIKRTANSASVLPAWVTSKPNAPFCVKAGGTVTWKSTSKNTGFMVDFGPNSPFSPSGTIAGGSDRSVSVVATRKGCYKFSAGACLSGATYGMCASTNSELIVVENGN